MQITAPSMDCNSFTVFLFCGRWLVRLLFALLAFRTIYEEAAFTAALVVAVVLDAAAIFVLAAVIDDKAEIAAASGPRMVGNAG